MRVLTTLALRPELTAVVGTVVVFTFFALEAGSNGFLTVIGTRNYLEVAAEIGIIAAAITLLLIAGEFDLSVGSMIGAGQMIIAFAVVELQWPLVIGLAIALVVACGVGLVNGYIVVRTGIPSFIVTLAMLFIIRGATQGFARLLVGGSTINGIEQAVADDPLHALFDGQIASMSVSLIWWIVLTVVAAWALDRTRFGNWIYGSGGDVSAARKVGVPVQRVKILLFMMTAMSAVLVGALGMFAVNQANVNVGTGKEFQAVAAAVIGGAAVTGGYGSPIGSAFGALLFGMVAQGFFFTDIPDEWYQTFLGVMVLIAVFINRWVRSVAMRPSVR